MALESFLWARCRSAQSVRRAGARATGPRRGGRSSRAGPSAGAVRAPAPQGDAYSQPASRHRKRALSTFRRRRDEGGRLASLRPVAARALVSVATTSEGARPGIARAAGARGQQREAERADHFGRPVGLAAGISPSPGVYCNLSARRGGGAMARGGWRVPIDIGGVDVAPAPDAQDPRGPPPGLIAAAPLLALTSYYQVGPTGSASSSASAGTSAEPAPTSSCRWRRP